MIFQLMLHSGENTQQFAAVFKGDAVFRFKKNRLSVTKLSGRKHFVLLPLHVMQIVRLCKKLNITVLHAHHRYFDFAGTFAAKILGIPIITSVQQKVYHGKMFKYMADYIIAPGESIKNHLLHYFHIPESKIRVINNFITDEDLQLNPGEDVSAFLEEHKIPAGRSIVLYVGSLSKEKGIDLLLKAMRLLVREYSDLFLLIVGDGEQKESIRKYCEAKLSDYAIIGSLENVFPCYKIADIIVLPSRADSFPLTLLEAGYFKKAVIASDAEGIPEIIDHGENGLLFARDSKEGLLTALRILLEDATLRVRYGNNLHKKVTQELMHKNKMPEYFALYESVSKQQKQMQQPDR
ncbi:MAG: glycosyltransferase family 4 protein [Ignavibacteriales bacterium]|nr:glycosyltransferase family 4 protein [Ignavibacteriales bacterium]